MSFPIRSPRELTGGICLLARIIDKIRLDAARQLPSGYHVGVIPGKRTFDDRLCCFLGVSWDALRERVLAGGSDAEILDWCFAHGRRPDAEQIEVWNTFMEKRGWRDEDDGSTQELEAYKAASGLAHRTDLVTFFDYYEVDEGRSPR
jgi:gluconokinase